MAAGLADPTMNTTASTSMTVTTEQQYSVVAVDPNDAIPNANVVTGNRRIEQTSEETITRNGTARPMTAMERYENMVDDLPSLSSDSSPPTPPTPSPTVSSSGSSGSHTLENIMNSMQYPPGGPTDNAGIANMATFKVMLVCTITIGYEIIGTGVISFIPATKACEDETRGWSQRQD